MESVKTAHVVDAGARGQAIAEKLAHEGLDVVVSPGNPGNEDFAISTGVAPTDIAGQLKAARDYDIDLTIIGAEDPQSLGIVDELRAAGRTTFGATKHQARIESDRWWAKQFVRDRDVPIGDYELFRRKKDKKAALSYASKLDLPVFVKNNEPAQGKGVIPCETMAEVRAAIKQFRHYVIEAEIPGPEASHHAFCDGKTHLSVPFLMRDHKRLENNDKGDMTGGMGVIGPLPAYSPEDAEALGETFVAPWVEGLDFQGMLFTGLKGHKGEEKALEWNARPGDPETQVVLRLMKSDLLPVIMACVEGDLASLPKPEWFVGQYAVSLVLAAPGYPKNPQTDMLIEGLDVAGDMDGVQVLQAGTKRGEDGQLYTAGGRVLNMVAIADSMLTVRHQALAAARMVFFDGLPPVIRSDVGHKAQLGY